MGDLSAKQEKSMRSMINNLALKMLHQPTVMLKQKAKEGTAGLEYIQTVNDLFDLKTEKEKESTNKVIQLK